DVKPHNLFVVSKHVKVADFGLVQRLGDGDPAPRRGGITPAYAAPEAFRGQVSRHSDQYSLAIVYQELLTGCLPLWDESLRQLAGRHLAAAPDLSPLPPEDRRAVAGGLSKAPEERFPSCTEFVQALLGVGPPTGEGPGPPPRVGGHPAPPAAPSRVAAADQR